MNVNERPANQININQRLINFGYDTNGMFAKGSRYIYSDIIKYAISAWDKGEIELIELRTMINGEFKRRGLVDNIPPSDKDGKLIR